MKRWIIPTVVGAIAVLALLLLKVQIANAAASFSPVPELIHYQARLASQDGAHVDGDVNVSVFVYDSATLGVSGDLGDEHLLYAEDHGAVRVERGMLRLTIGAGNSLGSFSGAPLPIEELSAAAGLYVDLYIEGERLEPRQSINYYPKAAYAQYAKTADQLEGDLHLIAANLPDELSASKVSGTLNPSRIPNLPSSRLSGTVSVDRLPGEIPLDRMDEGTLSASVIPNIDGEKINGGAFTAAQLPATLLGEGEVAFFSAASSNGGQIAIPSGFAATECAWIVGLGNNDDHTQPGGLDDFRIYTGSDINSKTYGTDIHCELQKNGWPVLGCDVRYLVVCKH